MDALEWYTADFERRTEIACVFEHNDVARLSDGIWEGSILIKVLLADDHSIVRAGLRRIVEESGDMQAAAEADDGREAI